jgi:hypothetical protein
LSYIADTLKSDVLFKVVPYFALYAGSLVAGDEDFIIPGFDLDFLINGVWVGIVASMVGSILNSMNEIGILRNALPDALVADEGNTGDARTVMRHGAGYDAD